MHIYISYIHKKCIFTYRIVIMLAWPERSNNNTSKHSHKR